MQASTNIHSHLFINYFNKLNRLDWSTSEMASSGSSDLTLDLVGKPDFVTANVSAFRHAPMSDFWDRLVTVGIKVEVINKDAQPKGVPKKINTKTSNGTGSSDVAQEDKVYWIATVIKINGYLAKLRYEGYEDDDSHDFWAYLFNEDVHGVGWCASQGKTLVPPHDILKRLPDWTMYLIKKLTGARTLPSDFNTLIDDSLKSQFRQGMKLEVVDKNRVSSVRVATVEATIGGRLLVSYDGAEPENAGFWTHEKSPLVHPIGWAQFVSHELIATYDYARESLEKVNSKKFAQNDATWDMFDLPRNELPAGLRFDANMKIEALDPLNLSSICVATIIKVLRCNYLMIGIDGAMCPTGSDWFCYHATSPYIFPAGFCKANNLKLTTPNNDENFSWDKYLEETCSRAAPAALFNKQIPQHGFREGMIIEAVDLMQSRLVCVATVSKVVGRLLRIHFNGWDETFDQWCDCESPDLFPWGWCRLVGYDLEPPKQENADGTQLQSPGDYQRRRRSNIRSRSASGKKRRIKPPTSQQPLPTSVTSNATTSSNQITNAVTATTIPKVSRD